MDLKQILRLTHACHILDVISSILGQKVCCPEFSWFSSVSPRKLGNFPLKCTTTTYFYDLFKSLFSVILQFDTMCSVELIKHRLIN